MLASQSILPHPSHARGILPKSQDRTPPHTPRRHPRPGRKAHPQKRPNVTAEFSDLVVLIDIARRVTNVLRPGTVEAIDHAAARVRIPSGELITD